MKIPTTNISKVSKYIKEGYYKMNPDKDPTNNVEDLDKEIYWLWHILWDYLSDSERVEYINIHSENFTYMINDLDNLIEYCSTKCYNNAIGYNNREGTKS